MLLLDRQSVATAQPRGEANHTVVSADRVHLRLRANGQLFELPPGKTTIGSSPRCNVRIEQPGVQPLHCLITEGPDGWRVRSWVANTALNGVPFEESALAIGDCLSLGLVELEVCSSVAAAPQPAEVAAPVVETKEFEQVRTGREQARARSRRLLDALRHERSSHHGLCQQVLKLQESHLDAIAEQSEISNKLERSLAELTEARHQLGELQIVETARQQLAARNEELGFEIGEQSAQISELAQGHAELVKGRQQLADDYAALALEHSQLTEAHTNLRGELAQVVSEKTSADDHSQQLEERNEQLGFELGELSAQINELTHNHSELTKARQQLADEHSALESQHAQLIQSHDRLQGEFGQVVEEKTGAAERIQQLEVRNSQLLGECDQVANENAALREESEHIGEIQSRLQSDIVQLANEKAAADEHNRSLVQQQLQLQRESGHLAEQKSQLEDQCEGLRQQNEQLLHEARELTGERGTLAEERTSLCQERSELRHQNELLRTRIAQLNDENSAMAVGKLTLVEQCDSFSSEARQLKLKLAELGEENAVLAAAKATLAEEQARFVAEQKRLAEIEREMGAAVAGRENTSAELYRALLQLAELQERDAQSKAIIETYEALSKEHDQLHDEADQLKEQISRLSEERTAVESAWQALSDEAATLSESQQRMADENASLVACLDEAHANLKQAQQKHAQQEQSTLVNSAAELERERVAKQQAEAEIVAAIAEGERRLEEQERRFAEHAEQFAKQSSQFNERSRQHAEAIDLLEQQLTAANESHSALAGAREAAQLQLANADSHRDEQSRRIQELESQLAEANDSHFELAQAREAAQFQLIKTDSHRAEQSRLIEELESRLAAAESRAAKAAELATSELAAARAEKASHIDREQPTEFRWSSTSTGSESREGLNPVAHDDETLRASLTDSAADEGAGDRPASASDAWHTVDSERTTPERTVAPWSSVPESAVGTDESSPWSEKLSSPASLDASTFGDDDDAVVAERSAEDAISSKQPSAWDQTAAEPETTFAEPVFAKPEESVQRESEPEKVSAPKQEPVSFIERYSHLLTEDGAANDEKSNHANDLASARPIVPVVARLEEVPAAAAKTEDEDSIEQYMAKLLQRVRGDSDGGKAAQEQTSRMPLNAPTAKPVERSTSRSATSAAAEGRVEGDTSLDEQPVDSGELIKRRASSPAPTTNLGALRALANETARLAISRHELRTLRRKGVTKTIVATLAGMTSLWLMLDSPDWRHVQFLTACVALLVAMYWAAEAFRMLLNSRRLAAFDGPEDTALPIDVEAVDESEATNG